MDGVTDGRSRACTYCKHGTRWVARLRRPRRSAPRARARTRTSVGFEDLAYFKPAEEPPSNARLWAIVAQEPEHNAGRDCPQALETVNAERWYRPSDVSTAGSSDQRRRAPRLLAHASGGCHYGPERPAAVPYFGRWSTRLKPRGDPRHTHALQEADAVAPHDAQRLDELIRDAAGADGVAEKAPDLQDRVHALFGHLVGVVEKSTRRVSTKAMTRRATRPAGARQRFHAAPDTAADDRCGLERTAIADLAPLFEYHAPLAERRELPSCVAGRLQGSPACSTRSTSAATAFSSVAVSPSITGASTTPRACSFWPP